MMNYFEKDPKQAEIRSIAQEWVIRNDHGLTIVEQNRFDKWLKADPIHRAIYLEESRYWGELDRLAGLQVSFRAPADPDIFDHIPVRKSRRLGQRLMSIAIVPLAALILLGFSVFLNTSDRFGPSEKTDDHLVAFERIRKEVLKDGSGITLNRGAEISIHYSDSERRVRLDGGQAHFQVAKDLERPFIVEVSGILLRAVGTAFNVSYSNRKLDVLVTEGVVGLQQIDPFESPSATVGEAFLEINQKATINIDDQKITTTIATLRDDEVENETLWQPVVIDFEDAPLSEIVAEFNRRNPLQIIITDPSIESFKLSSLFWSDNVEGFIKILDAKFDIKVRFEDPYTVYLYKP